MGVRRSVKERDWLLGVWKLKWGRIRIPPGMQLDVNVDCGPPVSQVQKLLSKERIVGRQVSCSGKITQKESALASIQPLLRELAAPRDSVERYPCPLPAFRLQPVQKDTGQRRRWSAWSRGRAIAGRKQPPPHGGEPGN